jgi:alpha-galactosidase/6-phospho-beta-glucosidase family protein
MNHQARVRDRKRLIYQKFLRWVNDPANGVKENEEVTKAELREDWLKKAKIAFPDFAKELEEVQKDMELRRLAKEKFNGIIAREITGLEGQDLGRFMQDFVTKYIEETLKMTKVEWALKHSPDQIRDAIKEWQKG